MACRKKTFCGVHRYRKRLKLQFWVGNDMQAMLRSKRYQIRRTWATTAGSNSTSKTTSVEVRELALVSYRHFALARMLKALDAKEA